jgi:predicted ribonuclease toxin of YeeF-YezG toxin-antitoxin module
MVSDMNEKVQALQNKFEKAGLVQRVGTAVGQAADVVTQGFLKGIFKSVVGAAGQEGKTLNAIQIENNLRKNLSTLDKLNKMDPAAAFRQLTMGGPPVTPSSGLTALQMSGRAQPEPPSSDAE